MCKIVWFSGSSSVGKSTTLRELDTSRFKLIPLSARDVRARLQNPTWDDLMVKSDLAMYHQEYILDSYIESMKVAIEDMLQAEEKKILVFERSLWDVVGYSVAYKCPIDMIDEQVSKIQAFETELMVKGHRGLLVKFEIDPSYPYELIPERPPETIRDACGEALKSLWGMSVMVRPWLYRGYFKTTQDMENDLIAEFQSNEDRKMVARAL